MKPGIDYIGVGVGAMIMNDKEEILLILRAKPPEINHWIFPGGKVDYGEKIETALRREIKEEIGVDIDVLKLVHVCDHIVDGMHWTPPAFLCKIRQGEPKLMEQDKHLGLEWFSINKLPGNLSIVVRDTVKKYFETRI